MSFVYVIGTSCTPFGKFPDKSFEDLTREAYLQVLADAGLVSKGHPLGATGRSMIHEAACSIIILAASGK